MYTLFFYYHHHLLLTIFTYLGLVTASGAFDRPECALTVPTVSNTTTILDFDDIVGIVPCSPRNSTSPYQSLYLTSSSNGSPSFVHNTSSTPSCHTHSGGSGPFGMATSWPNAVSGTGGINLHVANGTSFSWIGTSLMGKFDRSVYMADNDPLVLARARGYDACGNLVAMDTQAFYEMRRGGGPYEWLVTEPERWQNLQRVALEAFWWYEDNGFQGNGTALTKVIGAWYDNIRYIL